jgi:ATP-dependent Clp protease adaptor protein ClpS
MARPDMTLMAGPEDEERQGGGPGTGVLPKPREETKRPSLYKVLMLNDDYTPMEFVVYVLQRFFNMDHAKAVDVMLTVHNKGVAVVGVYSFEIAETKVAQVMDCARSNQHPLQCTIEKE